MPVIPAKVRGVQIPVALDEGARCSLVQAGFVARLLRHNLCPTIVRYEGAVIGVSGAQLEVVGNVFLTIQIDLPDGTFRVCPWI